MKKISSNIKAFFSAPVAKETLGVFRIGVASFALLQLLILLPDWMSFYGPDGFLNWTITDTLSTKHTPDLSNVANLFSALSNQQTLYVVTALYLLSLLGLVAGFKTRLCAFTAWLMHTILNSTGHFIAYGVETFTHIALFYCMVLPVGCCYSFDALSKTFRKPAAHLITLSVRLIQLHLCIMYFSCGIEKSLGTQWWNGEAIWIALQQDQFHQINVGWMAQLPIIPRLAGWLTLAVETLYPLCIFFAKTKRLWLVSIIAMHLSIALFLGLHLFGSIMIILNITAFGDHAFKGIFGYARNAKKRSTNNWIASGILSLQHIE